MSSLCFNSYIHNCTTFNILLTFNLTDRQLMESVKVHRLDLRMRVYPFIVLVWSAVYCISDIVTTKSQSVKCIPTRSMCIK